MRPILLWPIGAILLILMTLAIGWWRVDGPGAATASQSQRPLDLTEMSFVLTGAEARSVGPATLVGRPALVFFGFTHCPEVCPTTLSDISLWLDDLGEDAGAIAPVFITVDPERDTPERMTEYAAFFHPAIRGWSGSPKAIAEAADDFRVLFERVPLGEGEYTMDHTASVFLFDAQGRFRTTIDYHEPKEFAVPKIKRVIEDVPT